MVLFCINKLKLALQWVHIKQPNKFLYLHIYFQNSLSFLETSGMQGGWMANDDFIIGANVTSLRFKKLVAVEDGAWADFRAETPWLRSWNLPAGGSFTLEHTGVI